MSVIWVKVWFDLWHNKLRTLLVILSIAVGVFAVGTTFGLAEQMLPTMDAAHQMTLPAHVTMALMQPVDRDSLLALSDVPEVEEVEVLNMIEVRYKLDPGDKWRKGVIMSRDDYESEVYELLQLKAGSWPEGKYLNIERMHAPFYGIDVGDKVIFEVGKRERTFEISGKIRHPFVPPPSMYDMAYFFGGEDTMEEYGIPRGQFTRIMFRVTPYTDDHAREVASVVKERLAKQGVSVAATMYQDPNKHWGRAFVDGMALVTKVLAVISMLLSAVLVSNTLMAIITQQTNQLGILKAIGGTSFTVLRVYLSGVVIYGLLSLGIALPLGSLASFRISSWFLSLYNIEYTQFTSSPQATIFMVVAALVVPLAAALIPILQGAAITVRQAIASYGLGGDFGSNWIDRLVEGIGRRFLISYQAMALANTFRRKGRLLLTQLVLIIAGVMFLMVMSLSSSIDATLDAEFARRDYDVVISFDDLQRVDRTVAMMEATPGVDHAGMWLAVPATILHQGQKMLDAGLGSQLQGVPVEDPMYKPLIVEGRWLQPGDRRVIVMNKTTADDEDIRVGDTVKLDLGVMGESDWQVVGLYRVFLMFGGGFNIDALYGPRDVVFAATKKTGRANLLLVRTQNHTPEAVELTASQLGDLFREHNIEISQTETMPSTRRTSDVSFSYVVIMLLVLAVIVAMVGGIGLMGALWISVIERTKEIGVMRAIGALSRTIMGMFILEGIVQGLMSWVIAVPLSLLVTPIMANALGMAMFNSRLDFQFNIQAVFIWLGTILVVALVAAIIPARNATRINVRQSLNYE